MEERGARKAAQEAVKEAMKEAMKEAKLNTTNIWGRFEIDDESVDRCLRILEWYLDDHPDKMIWGERIGADGKTRLKIVYK